MDDDGIWDEDDDGSFSDVSIAEEDFIEDSDFDIEPSSDEAQPEPVVEREKKPKKKGYVDPAKAKKAAAKKTPKPTKEPKTPKPRAKKVQFTPAEQPKRALRASTKQAREESDIREELRKTPTSTPRKRKKRSLLRRLPAEDFINLLAFNIIVQENSLAKLMEDAERRRQRPRDKGRAKGVRTVFRGESTAVAFPTAASMYTPPVVQRRLPAPPPRLFDDGEDDPMAGESRVTTLLCKHDLPALYRDPVTGKPFHDAGCFKENREQMYNDRLRALRRRLAEEDDDDSMTGRDLAEMLDEAAEEFQRQGLE
ncbi:YL1 nuclear protein C-terminal domain [Carpediemonas membranifera]|uniref:YL1 nuclear protein C-terminal domain n=1 Tax=Carpediemonas membranifera TaxID=201153 RepID=A0A8J6DZ11_9EUKA|nr:YL1 nuclear protein C-terminal domain [Carpediemonas membranifera]|eukprot:KAG9392994.1 YL1 nuclear protein C-terminal domain [Carpediemonas membranifera]